MQARREETVLANQSQAHPRLRGSGCCVRPYPHPAFSPARFTPTTFPSVPRLPAQASTLLHDLKAHLPVILGKNLVGIYLYGSVTQRAFDPSRSDIDGIVVTRRTLTDRQFRTLRTWMARKARANPWTRRVQLIFLLKNNVLTMNAPSCLYQFGRLSRGTSDGNPIIWIDVLDRGVVLSGAKPRSLVPTISATLLEQALEREIGYLRAEMIRKSRSKWRDVPSYRAYVVLTLCRILYSFHTGKIVSKPVAARWAVRSLPRPWHVLIRQASRGESRKRATRLPLARIAQFIAFAEARSHRSP
jgi:hypothetical protein